MNERVPVDVVESRRRPGGDSFGLWATLEWIKMMGRPGGSSRHPAQTARVVMQCKERTMRIDLSNSKHPPALGFVVLASIVSLSALGASAPALAGCGVSNYQNLGGTHSATAQSGVHTATSSAPSGSTGAQSMSSCPTANATADRAGASPPRGHAINAHVVTGNSHGLERATANGKRPNSTRAGAVHTANLKKAKK
jgi:hypothetical protein